MKHKKGQANVIVDLDDYFGPPQKVLDYNSMIGKNNTQLNGTVVYSNETENYFETANFTTNPLPDNKTIEQINNYSV